MRKGVLQTDAEFIQFDRHNTDEGAGKKAFQNVQRSRFNVCSAALILDGYIEYGDNRAGDEQAPTEQRKQLDGRLHPFEVKDLRTHIADHFEAVGNRPVNNFVYPTEHGVPDSVGDTAFHYIYCVSDGVADA